MQSNLISDIFKFNRDAGFLGDDMDAFKELAYVLEESFEGFEALYNTMDKDGNPFKPGDKEYPTARQLGLSLANSIKDGMSIRDLELPSEVAEFDKSIDAIWFHIGKLAKMGLSEEQVAQGFDAVAVCNLAKLGGPIDDKGKQLKPEGWTGPEAELQKILDSRSSLQPSLFDKA